jgi:Protein of unknown function (DUF2845)
VVTILGLADVSSRSPNMIRPRRQILRLLAALALTALAGSARGDSINCDRGIVSTGDSKLDLLAKCGEPALMEARLEERSHFQTSPDGRSGAGRSVTVTVERWTYNFGPQRFLQFVTLETGRVVSVERGSYGYSLDQPRKASGGLGRAHCDQQAFRLGDSSFDVLSRCGEPALREEKQVSHSAFRSSGSGQVAGGSAGATVEIWTYNFGSRTFIRHLQFENGTLVRIETGGYGYDAP